MITKEIDEIIKKLFPKMFILNVLVTIVAFIILGIDWGTLIGLFIGLFFAMFNLIALGFTVKHAVRKSASGAKRITIASYFLRYLIFGIIFYISLKAGLINSFAVVVPQFYAKIIMTVESSLPRKERKRWTERK